MNLLFLFSETSRDSPYVQLQCCCKSVSMIVDVCNKRFLSLKKFLLQ